MIPQVIILNTERAFWDFYNIIQSVPFIREMCDADGEMWFPNQVGKYVLEYIADLDYAKGNILEYATEVRELFSDLCSEQEVDVLGQAVTEFGMAILKEIVPIAYTAEGALWYEFAYFVTGSLVIKRIHSNAPYQPPQHRPTRFFSNTLDSHFKSATGIPEFPPDDVRHQHYHVRQ